LRIIKDIDVLPTSSRAGPAAMIEVVEWLTGDECHDADDAALAAGLGRRLRAAGLPLDRLTLHLLTLHPEIFGRTIAWAPNEPVEIRDREHGIEVSAGFIDSPARRVMKTREPLVVHLEGSNDPKWIHNDLFEGRGLVEFVAIPLRNGDGLVSAVTFSTSRPSGFAVSERAALERVVPALRNACELRTLRRLELTLLGTYLGATTARRVLAGRVRRGQVETLQAALMLCDLRGFTAMSNRLPGDRVLELLNAYFDCVVPAIIGAGGEVIKFMGDAVLAFFHCEDAPAACSAGLQGALNALESLAGITTTDTALRAGIALHYGEVSYGNIGYGRRLDFTLIGPDVNLVSRIQAVCSTTDRSLLMSESFANFLDPSKTIAVGRYPLKGFAAPAALYTVGQPVET